MLIKAQYENKPDWYCKGKAQELVQEYNYCLQKISEEHLWLKKHIKRCPACKIHFLSDPRNKNRIDIKCPFGCRDVHRRKEVNKRSKKHYQTDEGKDKKKQRNNRRKKSNCIDPVEISENKKNEQVDELIDAPIEYLCGIASLIEKRRISSE